MNLFHLILMIIWPVSTYQENNCNISGNTMICEGIQQEDFLYQLYKNEDDFRSHYVSNIKLVNSNFSHIKSFFVPTPFSNNLRTLTFRNCSIQKIDNGAFQGNQLELDLKGNFIENISFIGNLDLSGLNLENNRIEILDLNTLVSIKTIDKIKLKGNKIKEIIPLKNFETFTFIDLSFNQIKSFNETYLNCFFLSIDLSHNELEVITILDIKYRTKKIINLEGNNITSLGPYANQMFTCDELYLTFIPTDLPQKFNVYKVFSIANAKIGSLNNRVFNMTMLSTHSSLSIDFSNSEISNISTFYLESVQSRLLNLSHNKLSNFSESIFKDSYISNLDLSFSEISVLSSDTFQGLRNNPTVNLTGNFLKTVESMCKYVKFSNIDLSYNIIDSIGIEAFVNCSYIQVLNISNSGITYIESGSFANLDSLRYLDLSNNNIMKLKEGAFMSLFRIETIDLSGNSLHLLETNVFQNLSVTSLVLWNTTIKYIQNRTFNNLYNLKTLNFSNTGVAFLEPNFFFNSRYLRTIDLRYNDLTTIDQDTFRDLSLTNLYLYGNKIEIIKSRAFENMRSQYLSTLNLSSLHINTLEPFSFSGVSVETIDLRDNNISEIRENVFFNTTATRVYLDKNNISNISAMDDILNIDELRLTFNGILSPRAISNVNLKRLFIVNSAIELLTNNCFMGLFNLEELYLNNSIINSFEPGALNGLFHLKQFDASNLFGDATVLEADLFSEMSGLKTLWISNTHLSYIPEGAFGGLENLNELYLTNNNLVSVNGSAFVHLKSLTLLDLSNNSINSINLSYMRSFKGLNSFRINDGHYPKLKELFLNNNRISSIDASTFQGLEGLETLHLQNNALQSVGYGTFTNLSNLLELRLNGNNLYGLKVGVFGGLKKLSILDLSDNTRLFEPGTNINVWGLKPNLKMINLDNTYLGYSGFYYTSLKNNNNYLKTIAINYNKFSCTELLNIINYFSVKQINYLLKNPRYDIDNIDGVVCGYSRY